MSKSVTQEKYKDLDLKHELNIVRSYIKTLVDFGSAADVSRDRKDFDEIQDKWIQAWANARAYIYPDQQICIVTKEKVSK